MFAETPFSVSLSLKEIYDIIKDLAEGKIKSLRVGGKYKIPKRYLLEFIYPDIDFTKEPE